MSCARKRTLFIFQVIFFCFHSISADLQSEYANSVSLKQNGIYKLYWTVNKLSKSIHFAVRVKTVGWIGFGISRGLSGKMKNADIVIGWVDNQGKGYLKDYHGLDHVKPIPDIKQDYALNGFYQEDGTTVLKFKRKLITCDPDDVDIDEGNIKVIFSWGTADPIDNTDAMLIPHGWKHKGSKSLNLLNYVTKPPLPAGTKYFDLVQKKVPIPPEKTTYWCQPFKISNLVKLKSRKHIIEIAPLVQVRSEPLVHHMVLYACNDNFNEAALNVSGNCYDKSMPQSFFECTGMTTMAAWGVGGPSFRFPENVGLPIGASDSVKYVILSIHFNNPKLKKGFVDSSGLRLYYTSPRKYDAALLTVGATVIGSMLIPPRQKSWTIEAYCPKECSTKIRDKRALNGDTIKIFSAMPHAHMTGNRIWTTLVRNGKEIKEVFRIDQFDFRYQQIYPLDKPVEFRAGDELHTYCRYNTTDRKYATIGGRESTDEMCFQFLMYYPRLDFQTCTSAEHLVANFAAKYGKQIREVWQNGTKDNDWSGLEWNSTMVKELENVYQSKSRNSLDMTCNGSRGYQFRTKLISHPKIKVKLRRKKKLCSGKKRNNVPESSEEVIKETKAEEHEDNAEKGRPLFILTYFVLVNMADKNGPGKPESTFDNLKKLRFSNFKEFIEKTPCARNSFLYGISSGMVAGISTFLYSKHLRKSCDLAVLSFAVVSLGSWELCRYQNHNEKNEIKKTVELLTKYSNEKEDKLENVDPKLT